MNLHFLCMVRLWN